MKTTNLGRAFLCLCAILLVTSRSTAAPGLGATITLGETSGNPKHVDAQERARRQNLQTATIIYKQGVAAFEEHDFVAAETDFRESLALVPSGDTYSGLAEVLAAQERTDEAMEVYRMLFHPAPGVAFGGTFMMRAGLKYALLLNQKHQWAEAVSLYEAALPDLPDNGMAKINTHFDANNPQLVAFEAAAHVALGIDVSWNGNLIGGSDRTLAFKEFAKAVQLAPNWATANYYYGYAWQHLDPKGSVKKATEASARAALQKAAISGNADVKKASQETLRQLN